MQKWHYQRAADFGLSLAESQQQIPREPKMLTWLLRDAGHLALRTYLKLFHRLEITGREHLQAGGSRILVCNHTSHLDTLCLMAAVPFADLHRTFPAAASDYFFCSTVRSVFSAVLINALPFERKHGGAASLDQCADLLSTKGNTLILFPEGTRTKDGTLGRFRSGVVRLARQANVPVVPCHLAGGLQAWPKGRPLPRPAKLRLHIGAPLSHRQFDRQSVAASCADLRRHVASLEQSS